MTLAENEMVGIRYQATANEGIENFMSAIMRSRMRQLVTEL
jgi:hypothetical protein